MRAEELDARASDSRRELHLGGPGERAGALRDLLAQRIRAVPSGGRIAWITYYFRDRGLAQDLIAAHARGVDVRVLLERRTRTRGANHAVIALLRAALGERLQLVDRSLALRIHAKLYLFSGEQPCALVGSFNPSGDAEELEPEVIAEIGDQDRAFNALVSLSDASLVAWLFGEAARLRPSHFARLGRLPRLRVGSWSGGGDSFWFLPRAGVSPLLERIAELGAGARVRLAVSHLSGRIALGSLSALAARGVRVEALAESTERRVPRALEAKLRAAGVRFTRVEPSERVPMHAKFTLIEERGEREVFFGSANWSDRSFRRNFEVLARSRDAALFDGFASYWERIQRFALESAARVS